MHQYASSFLLSVAFPTSSLGSPPSDVSVGLAVDSVRMAVMESACLNVFISRVRFDPKDELIRSVHFVAVCSESGETERGKGVRCGCACAGSRMDTLIGLLLLSASLLVP